MYTSTAPPSPPFLPPLLSTSHLPPPTPSPHCNAGADKLCNRKEKKSIGSHPLSCNLLCSVLPSLPQGLIGCPTYHDGCQDGPAACHRVTARLSVHPSTPTLPTSTVMFVAVHGLTARHSKAWVIVNGSQMIRSNHWDQTPLPESGPRTEPGPCTQVGCATTRPLRSPSPLWTDTRQTISLRPVLSHPPIRLSSSPRPALAAAGHGRDGLAGLG